jgi:hypothetical protein
VRRVGKAVMKEAANCGGLKCPEGVMSAVLSARASLPIYPEQQTLRPAVRRSLRGHKRKSARQRADVNSDLACAEPYSIKSAIVVIATWDELFQ